MVARGLERLITANRTEGATWLSRDLLLMGVRREGVQTASRPDEGVPATLRILRVFVQEMPSILGLVGSLLGKTGGLP